MIERRPVNPLYKPAAVAISALALAALPTTALAHHGQPFKNCTEAYEAGYANILEGSEHYKPALDRDKDGVGCDQPPSDFVPADDKDENGSGGNGSDENGKDDSEQPAGAEPSEQDDTSLAETGGDSTTPYIAGAGAAVVLAGGGLLVAIRQRRASR